MLVINILSASLPQSVCLYRGVGLPLAQQTSSWFVLVEPDGSFNSIDLQGIMFTNLILNERCIGNFSLLADST